MIGGAEHTEIRKAIVAINKGLDPSCRLTLSNATNLFFMAREIGDYTVLQKFRIRVAHHYLIALNGTNIDRLKSLLIDDSVENKEELKGKLSKHSSSFFRPKMTKAMQAFDLVEKEGKEGKELRDLSSP